jgi:hypothetical protein
MKKKVGKKWHGQVDNGKSVIDEGTWLAGSLLLSTVKQ